MLGGGPFNVSDPPEHEVGGAAPGRGRAARARHPRRRGRLPVPRRLLRHRHARHPGRRRGRPDVRRADRRRGDPADRRRARDPLLGALPDTFDAFLGHKEAVSRLPDGRGAAGVLGRPARCRRSGSARNVYATQFHPELDVPGLLHRIEVYRHHGYFDPADLAVVLARAGTGVVTEPPRLLAGFAERYAALAAGSGN